MTDPIKTALKRIKWPISEQMQELVQQFAEDFSQAYFDAYDEKMEPVDIEEYVLMIEKKLKEVNGWDGAP